MNHSLRWILGSLVCVSVTACGGDDSNGPSGSDGTKTSAATEQDYDDVAQSLGVAVASSNNGGDVGSLSDSVSIAVGLPPLDIQLKAAGQFAGVRAGLSYDYAISCRDEQGASLDACGAATDDATVQVNWSGALALPSFAAHVQRTGEWQLANVKSGRAEFTGSSDFSFDATFQSSFRDVERHWSLDYSADYAGVVVQLLPRQVVGGSIRYSVTAERHATSDGGESDARFTMAADVAFSANGASLVIDGSHSYAVDVNSGAVRRETR